MPKPKNVLSLDALAAMVGVSDTTLKAHKLQGCPLPTSKADLPAWAQRYHRWRIENGKVQAAPSASALLDQETVKQKRELARWRTMLAKLDVGQRMGELVPRPDIVRDLGQAALVVRNRLLAGVKKCASIIGPLVPGQGGTEFVEEVLMAEAMDTLAAFQKGLDRIHDSASPDVVAARPGSAEELPGTGTDDGQ